jgi:hypothetical protein
MALTQVQSGMMDSIAQYNSFKNRIINGGMVIDQRNNGASVTVTGGSSYYSCDRWQEWMSQNSKYSIQRSTTAPAGFINSLLATSLSAYSVVSADSFALAQNIEGLNIADFAWGTANAATVTLSFWVRSSLTGTFGGAISNSAVNRSYPFTYTISAANTFEYKTITIAGDTSGTWLTDNGIGIRLWFSIGAGSTYLGTAGAWAGADYRGATGQTSVVGTSGATIYITGVQLEKGSTATSFDYRPYGTELQLCQRYFEKSYDQATLPGAVSVLGNGAIAPSSALAGSTAGNITGGMIIPFKVSKRATPTIVTYDYDGTANAVRIQITTDAKKIGVTGIAGIQESGAFQFMTFSSASAVAIVQGAAVLFSWTASAEL